MKRIALSLFLLAVCVSLTYSQSQRLVLLEEFTQASCGPCASWNPTIMGIINQYPDKITAIMYHTSWPGTDPMYNHNPVDANARVDYYGVNAVPHSVLDGNFYSGHPQGWNANSVLTRAAVPSPFEMDLQQTVSQAQDSVFLTLLIKATGDVSGELKAHMVVIEKHVKFTSPPGSNGEKDFYFVMKKLLPTKAGTILPTSFTAGDYVILQSSWKLANIYDMDELASVCFVQNNAAKEVHQAVVNTSDPITPPFADDSEVIDILNVSQKNCLGVTSPHVVIRNNGSSPLTSLVLHYSVNGGPEQTHAWQGNLSFLETSTVELPEISFDLLDDNDLMVYSTSPNGTPDQYVKNDTMHKTFDKATESTDYIRVVIITDGVPQENTWKIFDSQGAVVFSGGPYPEPNHLYQEYYTLPHTDCYKFVVFDTGGNGLCCVNGTGAWGVYNGSTELGKGGIFTHRDSTSFQVLITGTENKLAKDRFMQVSPNPSDGDVRVILYLQEDAGVTASVFSQTGELVRRTDAGLLGKGENTFTVGQGLRPGLYMLRVKAGRETYTEKILIK